MSGRGRRVVAAVAVAATLVSCTSDPGPGRVARDIVETEAEANPALDEDCLKRQLERFSDDELSAISERVRSGSADVEEQGRAELDEFRTALESCV